MDAAHFLASKLSAYEGRGEQEPALSHDLEDFVRVVDGRPDIVNEVRRAPAKLASFLSEGVHRFLDDQLFLEAFPGYFDDGIERARVVMKRLEALKT